MSEGEDIRGKSGGRNAVSLRKDMAKGQEQTWDGEHTFDALKNILSQRLDTFFLIFQVTCATEHPVHDVNFGP